MYGATQFYNRDTHYLCQACGTVQELNTIHACSPRPVFTSDPAPPPPTRPGPSLEVENADLRAANDIYRHEIDELKRDLSWHRGFEEAVRMMTGAR